MIGQNVVGRTEGGRDRANYLEREDAIWALKCGAKDKILLLAMNYLDCWEETQYAIESLASATGMTRLDIQVALVTRPLVMGFVSGVNGGET